MKVKIHMEKFAEGLNQLKLLDNIRAMRPFLGPKITGPISMSDILVCISWQNQCSGEKHSMT